MLPLHMEKHTPGRCLTSCAPRLCRLLPGFLAARARGPLGSRRLHFITGPAGQGGPSPPWPGCLLESGPLGLAWGSTWEGCRRGGWAPGPVAVPTGSNICPRSHVAEEVPQRSAPTYSGRPRAFLGKLFLRACVHGGGGGRRHFRQLHSCGHGGQMLVQGGRWGPLTRDLGRMGWRL